METRVRKSMHGEWYAETFRNVNGQDFEVYTGKGRGYIQTHSTPVERGNDFGTTSRTFDDMTRRKTVIYQTICDRVTEKAITEHHMAALEKFDAMVEAGLIKGVPTKEHARRPEIGSIIFLDGYNKGKGDEGNELILYDIVKTSFGTHYLTVDLRTNRLQRVDNPRNYKEKFGIGHYFENGYKYDGTTEELAAKVAIGIMIDKREKEEREREKIEQEQRTADAIARGKEILTIPEWAKSVILAKLYQDDSDSMTDYFSTSVERMVILGFSRTDRNNMQELKDFAKNFEETKDLTEEHRNVGGYYLPEFYVGTSRWSGWKVVKDKYILNRKDELYLLAGEGNISLGEEKETKVEEVKTNGIEIVDYSEKAFVVIGDTKPIKDELKAMGGRFNFRLSCGAGWIFSKAKSYDEVKSFIESL